MKLEHYVRSQTSSEDESQRVLTFQIAQENLIELTLPKVVTTHCQVYPPNVAPLFGDTLLTTGARYSKQCGHFFLPQAQSSEVRS